ncbi:MAG: helicase-related protein [Limisphaerales bacterium]
MRCIATSATLGSDQNVFPSVAKFAERLFSERFEWIEEDNNRQDVIKAIRKPMSEFSQTHWTPTSDIYVTWQSIIDKDESEIDWEFMEKSGLEAGIPQKVVDIAIAAGRHRNSVQAFLYEILKGDAHLISLQQALEQEPQYLEDIALDVFGEKPDPRESLVSLVDLANKARLFEDDQPLIPARYHLFVRAIEGGYLSLRPSRRLYLERRDHVIEDGQAFSVFEIASCRQCGAIYLVGELQEIDGKLILKQPGKQYFENPDNLEFYYLPDGEFNQLPLDEDEEISLEDIQIEEKDYVLCAACRAIDQASLLTPLCACGDENHLSVLHVTSRQGRVHSCPACGSTSSAGLVSRFLSGNDATASVLATALYQEIPPKEKLPKGEDSTETEMADPWAIRSQPVVTKVSERQVIDKKLRQLLIFSDSRQDAAFFAPYLERTHSQIMHRRLILQVLQTERDKVLENRWRVGDLVNPLRRIAERVGILDGLSHQQKEAEAWKWVFHELLALNRRNSLEGLGLLGFTLVMPDTWVPFKGFHDLGFSQSEAQDLYQVLLANFRTKGAVLFPDIVSPQDDFFAPRNREYFFVKKRFENNHDDHNVFGWSPTRKNGLNSRLDYILRVIRQGFGFEITNEEGSKILNAIWSNDLFPTNQSSNWNTYFSAIPMNNGQIVYRISPDYWELRPSFLDPTIEWYLCDTCNNFTLFNVRNVCPTYQCPGRLCKCNPQEVFKDNHYRILYSEGKLIRLIAKEHTAQLTSQSAAELQTKFMEGDVNVLSCSTTFELGVDVGELETVFMRNVPPSPANYIQRAGRAGRRTSSTAFALTFAQRRSHDLTHYNNPLRLVAGEIKAPYFEIANEKVVRRHIYATSLASFWREYPDTFHDVKAFFFREGKTGTVLVEQYLSQKPRELLISLQRIVPPELRDVLQIDTWGWVSGLLDPVDGVLSIAKDRVTSDVYRLDAKRDELVKARRPSDFILKVINTIKDEYLISFLSKQNVIPKYGFPVDVVDLQIIHHSDEAKALELSRDLRVALSEYAPSGQVVAGGKLWTSRYIKKLPDRSWRKFTYAVCEYCQCYQRVQADTNEKIENCVACGRPLSGYNRGDFIIPQFGFITEITPPGKPGESRPERTFTTRTYFRGVSKDKETLAIPLREVNVVVIPAMDGELAVINHAGYQGFKICYSCGYAVLGNEPVKSPHQTPWRTECRNKLTRVYLGHEFKTDVLQIRFEGYTNAAPGFWYSLLYALLEGASQSLEVDRQDLDGVLYPYAGDLSRPALVLFDDVPGGAGHVRRIAENRERFVEVLRVSLAKLKLCNCGSDERDTSCYGCLRNYRNQFCHDQLRRGPIIDFISTILS